MRSALLGAVTAALLAVPPPGPAGVEAGGPDRAATREPDRLLPLPD